MFLWILFNGKLKEIRINFKQATTVKENLKQAFELDNFNIRLRNSKGHLIVINHFIKINSIKNPYTLETYELNINQNNKSIMIDPYKMRIKRLETLVESNCFRTVSLKMDKYIFILKLILNLLQDVINIQSQIEFIESILNFNKYKWTGFSNKYLLW
jgi:hypothetical protein